jgi:HEPN domain-containing protein
MQPRETGQRWLEQADEDLRWTQHLLQAGAYYLVCFLSQQVGEQALKALLYSLGEEYLIGHSVEQLCRSVSAHLPELADHCESWEYLDNFYIPTRCPDALPGGIPARVYNRDAAEGAASTAAEIVATVHGRMEQAQG